MPPPRASRSEEHTSELQSLITISYAVFCLKKKNKIHEQRTPNVLTYFRDNKINLAINFFFKRYGDHRDLHGDDTLSLHDALPISRCRRRSRPLIPVIRRSSTRQPVFSRWADLKNSSAEGNVSTRKPTERRRFLT